MIYMMFNALSIISDSVRSVHEETGRDVCSGSGE